MAGEDDKFDRLKGYLEGIPDDARRKLIETIDRHRVAGAAPPEYDIILAILRDMNATRRGDPERVGPAMRVFWRFLEPYLTDWPDAMKQRGRVPRSALGKIGTWINRDLLPDVLPAVWDDISLAILDDEPDVIEGSIAHAKQRILPVLARTIERCDADDAAQQKLASHIGGPLMIEHIRDIHDALMIETSVARLMQRLDDDIDDPGKVKLESMLTKIGPILREAGTRADLVLAAVVNCFQNEAQALRVPVVALGSDDVNRIVASPYRIIWDLVMFELDNRANTIEKLIDEGGLSDEVTEHVLEFGRIAAAARTEVNISSRGAAHQRLASARAKVGASLGPQLEQLSGHLQTVFAPISTGKMDAPPNRDALALAIREIKLLSDVRRYAQDLAISGTVSRVRSQADTYMERANANIIEHIRRGDMPSDDVLFDYLHAAVDTTESLHGADFARVVRRLGEAAQVSASERENAA